MGKSSQSIQRLTDKIQNLINQLHAKEPNNKTFEQEGMLNGAVIVQEYLREGELGLALEHLLYMVYESEVSFPVEITEQLMDLAEKYKIKNPYL